MLNELLFLKLIGRSLFKGEYPFVHLWSGAKTGGNCRAPGFVS